MNKLKFVNPTALDLTSAFGITDERAEELGKQLDIMMKHFCPEGRVMVVYMSEVIWYMEDFVTTDEERIWCIVNHCQWAAKQGRMIPPQKK